MKSHTMGDVVAAIFAQERAAPLVSDRALETLVRTLDWFPRPLSRIFGFECRLDSDADQTDVFFRVEPEYKGRGLLSGSSELGLDERLRAHPSWRAIAALARDWERAEPAAWQDVPQIWFELDLTAPPAEVPIPGILFWNSRFDDRTPTWTPAGAARKHVELTCAAVRRATGLSVAPDVLASLERCLALLPPAAGVFCIGVMIGRTSRDLRLCLKGFQPGEHVPYLERIGLPRASEARPLFDSLAGVADTVQVCLDVGSSIGPAAHFELRHDRGELDEHRWWRRLVDWLRAGALVRDDKAEALIRWMGEPLEIQLAREPRRRLILRKLSHVKLAWRAGETPRTKGYFGVWESYDRWDELRLGR